MTQPVESESPVVRVLVTGFEPFGGDATNPTVDVVEFLQRTAAEAPAAFRIPLTHSGEDTGGSRADIELTAQVLPVEFGAAQEQLTALIRGVRPDVVLSFGLAAGRTEITPERVAINVADARIPDNSGHQPVDVPLVSGGPAAYFSTLPIKALAGAVNGLGIPAAVSNSAGTYVCNAVMYRGLHEVTAGGKVRAGFIHVPSAAELSQHKINEAAAEIVRVAARYAALELPDITVAGGTVE